MTIKEMSRAGAQVETRFPLSSIPPRVPSHAGRIDPFVVKGRVAHCSISDVESEIVTYRSGVEFVEAGRPRRLGDFRFIDAIKDGRRAL